MTTNSTTGGEDAAKHMDGIYRYQRYIYDLTRKYYLLGRDRMIAGLESPPGGTILEVGCGTGRNLILAARAYPDAKLFGFDISSMMLETARANIAKAGLADRIQLAQGDASDFSVAELFSEDGVDRVFISYTLSMVPPWKAALPQAYRAVRPGGSLHIVDFGQQSDLPRWFKSVLEGWLAKFSVTPRADLETELQKLVGDKGGSLDFTRLYRDYAQYAVVRKV